MSIKKLCAYYSDSLLAKTNRLNKLIDDCTRLGEEGWRSQDPFSHNLHIIMCGGSFQQFVKSKKDIMCAITEFLQEDHVLSQANPIRADEKKLADLGIDLPTLGKTSSTWIYQDAVYTITGSYSEEQQKLLILESADKERQKFERLSAKFSAEQSESIKYERTRIPEQVRIEVWRRDQGKCASCGSRERLEYDHIVPVSRGGSNTARNVELLCEDCNRTKGNWIG